VGLDLRNCDCMELMSEYTDKYFDIAIVDPPYGLGDKLTKGGEGHSFDSLLNGGSEKWDVIPNKDYFSELFRVSKNQIIWGGNFFELPPTKQPICWNKLRPNQKNLSEWEMGWTSFEGRARLFTFCANGGFITKEKRIHPTQKPIELYKWVLSVFAKEGDKILDTHLGSGSIAIACHDYKFDLTACEIDKEYFDATMKRVSNHLAQTVLF
jgi:site-specific DNA-methyltransferase (adenine-specific)